MKFFPKKGIKRQIDWLSLGLASMFFVFALAVHIVCAAQPSNNRDLKKKQEMKSAGQTSGVEAGDKTKKPRIYFEDVFVDKGEMHQFGKIEHVFEFVNKGEEKLIIEKVEAG